MKKKIWELIAIPKGRRGWCGTCECVRQCAIFDLIFLILKEEEDREGILDLFTLI